MKNPFNNLSFRRGCAICLMITAMLFTSCDKNDDDSPQDPVSQLPAATMTGENTFGALLDGEPFIPGGGMIPLDAQYQLINGERFFNLKGRIEDENFNVISLSLYECERVRRGHNLHARFKIFGKRSVWKVFF